MSEEISKSKVERLNMTKTMTKCQVQQGAAAAAEKAGIPEEQHVRMLLQKCDELFAELQELGRGKSSKLNKEDLSRLHDLVGSIRSEATEICLQNVQLSAFKEATKLYEPSVQRATYANMAAKPREVIQVTRDRKTSVVKRPVVIILPENKGQSSRETRDKVYNITKQSGKNIRINQVKPVRNGGILIETSTESELKEFTLNDRIRESGFKTEIPKKKMPRIIFYDVCRKLTESEVKSQMYKQNFEPEMEQDKFTASFGRGFRSGPKKGETLHWVFEVTPDLRKDLLRKQKVYVDWARCKVSDYTSVARCSKCLQYGHVLKFCKQEEHTCSNCGEKGHSHTGCQAAKSEQCYHCKALKKASDHKITDKKCPVYVKALEAVVRKTDYGL